MNFDDIEAVANGHQFSALGVPVTVYVEGELSKATSAILDRDSAVRGPDGLFSEDICVITLQVADVPGAKRGTVVDTGKADDRWKLLEKIGGDQLEERWTAGKDSG